MFDWAPAQISYTAKKYGSHVRCVGGVPESHALSIIKSGTGNGTITSIPAGIACGEDCAEVYNYGSSVTLVAEPGAGTTFDGWSGDADCSDGVVTMNGPKTCTATFTSVSAVSILSPSSGDILAGGSPYPITWIAPAAAVRFKIAYSIDNKLSWVVITKEATEWLHTWSVPANTKNKKAYLKIVGYKANGIKVGSDTTDSYFTIEVVNILSPNGGGPPLVSGTPVDITWKPRLHRRPQLHPAACSIQPMVVCNGILLILCLAIRVLMSGMFQPCQRRS